MSFQLASIASFMRLAAIGGAAQGEALPEPTTAPGRKMAFIYWLARLVRATSKSGAAGQMLEIDRLVL